LFKLRCDVLLSHYITLELDEDENGLSAVFINKKKKNKRFMPLLAIKKTPIISFPPPDQVYSDYQRQQRQFERLSPPFPQQHPKRAKKLPSCPIGHVDRIGRVYGRIAKKWVEMRSRREKPRNRIGVYGVVRIR
jgi:hypothetical protein